MNRKPLTNLSTAQKLWGVYETTFIRPQYVDDGCCEWCGKKITEKRRKSFCSKECSTLFNLSTSSLYYANQGSRGGYGNHILRRDNYSCQICGEFHGVINEHGIPLPTTDGKLQIHHKIYVCNGGTDEPSNLITVCEYCHHEIHKEDKKH